MTDIFTDKYGMPFEDVAKKFRISIAKLAYRYVGNMEDSDDVAQEVLLSLYKNPEAFENGRNLNIWINAITRNTAMSLIRRKNGNVSLDEDPREYKMGETVVRNPEKQYISGLLAKQLLSYMTPEQETIMLLHVQQGYTLKEIGQMLEMPEGTVKLRFYEAQKGARLNAGDNDDYFYGFKTSRANSRIPRSR